MGSLCNYYNSNKRWEKIMALFIGLGVCFTRLATAVSEASLGIATVVGIYLWWRNSWKLEISDAAWKYIKVAYIFFFATLISIVDVDNKLYVLQNFFSTWVWRFMVFILIVAFVKKQEYLLKILASFLIIYSLDCFTACYQFFVLHWERGRGFHGDYLDLTAIICMVLALSAIMVLDRHFELWIRRIAIISLIASLAGLFGCFGRGAFLVSALVAPFYLVPYLRRSKKIAAIVLSALVLLGGMILTNPKYVDRLSTTFNTTTNGSNLGRIWVWKSSINMYLDHPVNGVGLNNWGRYYRSEYQYPEETQNLSHAHSNYMHLLGETGTIGFAGFLFFIGYSLYFSFKSWRKEHNPCDLIFFTAFLSVIVLFGVFHPTYRLSSVIRTLWFILAIMIQMRQDINNVKRVL